jgi:hypothetical protein
MTIKDSLKLNFHVPRVVIIFLIHVYEIVIIKNKTTTREKSIVHIPWFIIDCNSEFTILPFKKITKNIFKGYNGLFTWFIYHSKIVSGHLDLFISFFYSKITLLPLKVKKKTTNFGLGAFLIFHIFYYNVMTFLSLELNFQKLDCKGSFIISQWFFHHNFLVPEAMWYFYKK